MPLGKSTLSLEQLVRNNGLLAHETVAVWKGLDSRALSRRQIPVLKWVNEIRIERSRNRVRRFVWVKSPIVLVVHSPRDFPVSVSLQSPMFSWNART